MPDNLLVGSQFHTAPKYLRPPSWIHPPPKRPTHSKHLLVRDTSFDAFSPASSADFINSSSIIIIVISSSSYIIIVMLSVLFILLLLLLLLFFGTPGFLWAVSVVGMVGMNLALIRHTTRFYIIILIMLYIIYTYIYMIIYICIYIYIYTYYYIFLHIFIYVYKLPLGTRNIPIMLPHRIG